MGVDDGAELFTRAIGALVGYRPGQCAVDLHPVVAALAGQGAGEAHAPRLNGKVERSHRIDSEEFYRMLDGIVIDDTDLFNDKLQQWEDYYNFDRPTAPLTAKRHMKD